MKTFDESTAEEYARWFQCLADPTRLRILHTLATARRALSVGEIVEQLDKSQSTVSKHLQLLTDARYVFCEPDGVRTLVRINTTCMTALPEVAAFIMATDTLEADQS